MKNQLDTLIQQYTQFSNGIAYIVPNKWWGHFSSMNERTKTIQQLKFPQLNLQRYVDNFLLEFQEGIIAELQHKSNYLKLNKVLISPQIRKQFQWKLITPQLWRLIVSKVKAKFAIITLYFQKDPSQVFTCNQIQVQIIFCSKVKSEAFVGFLPEFCNVASAIRNIGFQLGFIQMANSRITFPDKNPQKPYYYCQLQSTTLTQSPDTLFLAFNLECTENKNQKAEILDISFGKNEQLGNSNQAVAGDMQVLGIQSFQHVRNDRTISTGAQTPSFFASEQQNRGDFRVRELFRAKKPQQIKQLRQKAKKKIHGDLIKTVQQTESSIQVSLQIIVYQLQELISTYKKKTLKDKQIYLE